MKTDICVVGKCLVGLLLLSSFMGCASDGTAGGTALTTGGEAANGAATASERADLTFIREEEKLAHDVYVSLGGLWDLQVFSSIPPSESGHMAAIGTLLVAYGIPDPITADVANQFSDPTLQGLDTQLLAKGAVSVDEALQVGALIEEYDLVDIGARRAHSTKPDILAAYDQLMLGSRNHLRGFHSQLVARSQTYAPQFLSQAEYDAIVSSAHEKGAP
jgi:hypothetical protein